MKRLALFFTLGCILQAGSLAVSDLKNRTLPPEIYAKLGKGRAFPLVWRESGSDLSKGWTVAAVEYKAEELNSGLLEAFKTQAASLAQAGAPLRATFRVTFQHRNWADTVTFTVEGQLQDADGKIVAAFVDSESYTESVRNPGKNAVTALDKFFSNLQKELK